MTPLTFAEASRRCHLSEPTLRSMARRGELDTVRVGSRVFVTEDAMRSTLGILFK
jgi:excisionase family DNA binding protein